MRQACVDVVSNSVKGDYVKVDARVQWPSLRQPLRMRVTFTQWLLIAPATTAHARYSTLFIKQSAISNRETKILIEATLMPPDLQGLVWDDVRCVCDVMADGRVSEDASESGGSCGRAGGRVASRMWRDIQHAWSLLLMTTLFCQTAAQQRPTVLHRSADEREGVTAHFPPPVTAAPCPWHRVCPSAPMWRKRKSDCWRDYCWRRRRFKAYLYTWNGDTRAASRVR